MYSKAEPLIKPMVELLEKHGYKVLGASQGGGDMSVRKPFVAVENPGSDVAGAITELLLNNGLPHSIKTVVPSRAWVNGFYLVGFTDDVIDEYTNSVTVQGAD